VGEFLLKSVKKPFPQQEKALLSPV